MKKNYVFGLGLAFGFAIRAFSADYYVAQNGQTPGDFKSWSTAASNIADAVSVATAGETVWVGSGEYTLTQQVVVGNIKLRSWPNGSSNRDTTIINGNYPNTTNRCFYLNHVEALVQGFTITNGLAVTNWHGGGVYINSGTLKGCLVTGNYATNLSYGAGVYAKGSGSLIDDCDLVGNVTHAWGGGAALFSGACLQNSRIRFNTTSQTNSSYGPGETSPRGGGVYVDASKVLNCEIVSNRLSGKINPEYGGGIAAFGQSVIRNCLIADNFAWRGGGMTANGYKNGPLLQIENCTIVSNEYGYSYGGLYAPYAGGNVDPNVSLVNSIVWYNKGILQIVGNSPSNIVMTSSCSPSITLVNTNCTSASPDFIDFTGGDYRLRAISPCRDTGFNESWMNTALDLDGNPRIDRMSGQVDMGCYETVVLGTTIMIR